MFDQQTKQEEDEDRKGKAFVRSDYEPKDGETEAYIVALGESLKVITDQTRTTSRKKLIRCLSDLIMACRFRYGDLICWLMGKNVYSDPPYSYTIAKQVYDAAIREGLIELAIRGKRTVAARYRVNFQVPDGLKFREHGEGRVLEVRAKKKRIAGGKFAPVKRVSLKRFGQEAERLEGEMKAINKLLKAHPLEATDGLSQWCSAKRIFSDGSLQSGGRLYGNWQGLNSEERLRLTIDGERLCEIDIKACYIFLANAMTGNTMDLPADPYRLLGFVKRENCPDRQEQMRNAAKRLIPTYLSKKTEMVKFPVGKKDEAGRTVTYREEFGIHESVKVGDMMQDAYETFPFLKDVPFRSGALMWQESNIMVKTLLVLAELDIPAYPVHDCLLCKERDKDLVIDQLQWAMIKTVGCQGFMDVEYLDRPIEMISPDPRKTNRLIDFSYHKNAFYDWGIQDDGFDLIEDD